MENLATQVEREGYTTKELAYLLNISKATIYRLVKAGKLHPILFGTKLIFLKDDIERFIKEEQANRKPRKGNIKKTKAANN
jgi:excisionase family DNA binding protein